MANILIVDDSITSRKVLRTLLEEDKHIIVGEATDGAKGVSMFLKLHPDLVTMDINMPILDGISALKEIKQLDPNAKVIMITTAGQRSRMIEAIRMGATEFLSKPFEPDQIKQVVQTVTSNMNSPSNHNT